MPPVPGAFIINIGDLMALWTNDRWVSTLHRVVNPPPDAKGSTRRQSFAFFHQPNWACRNRLPANPAWRRAKRRATRRCCPARI